MDLGICAGRILTPQEELRESIVSIDGGKIVSIDPYHEDVRGKFKRLIDARHWTLVPGFIDLQVNGGLGANFPKAAPEKREEIYRFFLVHGTTTLVPTICTDAPESLERGLASMTRDVGHTRFDLPALPGLHLEGPFINPERRGAHPVDHCQTPSVEAARRYWEAAQNRISIVTLAPELEGADDVIRWFADQGVVVSAGHTTARCSCILKAWDLGLTMLTHMGNASNWPHRRKNRDGVYANEPGVVGSFLISGLLRGSVILDGYHFDPRLVYALCRARGPENVVLVSDASFATGCPPGEYDDGVMPTTVHANNYAVVTGGDGALAGSVITIARAIRVAVRNGSIRLRDAIEMATLTPAKVLGIQGVKGQIAPDHDADLALLDGDLHVKRVFRAGREVPGCGVD